MTKRKKKIGILLLTFYLMAIFIPDIYSQKHDYTWLLGYNGLEDNTPEDSIFGISVIDFNANLDPAIYYDGYHNIDLFECNVSMSNAEGAFIFAFNGFYIVDQSRQIMQNGDSLSNDYETGLGYILNQGGLGLPWPDEPELYLLLHEDKGWIDLPGWWIEVLGLYYTVIDMNGNNGLGAVTEKAVPFIIDTLQSGQMTATRHANGRDWWILINESHTNRFNTLLFAPEGIQIVNSQTIGETVQQGLGQGVFSPDGTKFVMLNLINSNEGQFLNIYDFDRCSGELFNPILIHFTEEAHSGGISISPNSRFLYLSFFTKVYQFDLWAEDIEASKQTVAEYDGFLGPFPTTFYSMQLAPNGKIYFTSANGINYLHTIHHPNLSGIECGVMQHDLELPTFNGASIPNNPNYRLGPIDGSICDTLGVNNNPVALFRSDTLDHFHFSFTDLSYYQPESWLWDFGDNTTSTEQNPQHIFLGDGFYEVCLTVSNENDSDTWCQTYNLGTTSTMAPEIELEAAVFPNPFDDYLVFEYSSLNSGTLILYNMLGTAIQKTSFPKGQHIQKKWNTKKLPQGMYILKAYVENKPCFTKKIIHLSDR